MKTKKITFRFYNEDHIASKLIKIRLGTIFSHVAVDFYEDGLYHSTMMDGTHREDDYDGKVVYYSTIDVDEDKYQEALKFVKDAEGTLYDFRAILGFIITKRFSKDKNYFCSELARIVFEISTGVKLPLYTLITPGQMRLISETYRLTTDK